MPPRLRSVLRRDASGARQIEIAEKKATPKGGPSQGGNARVGLWESGRSLFDRREGEPETLGNRLVSQPAPMDIEARA
ncbi:hypothetical protein BEL01nite_53870 [Bradyrhizobium elkanii]|nr:hypothetical protein BEL01nite_53870 [Bradyrhizobium elkanii]